MAHHGDMFSKMKYNKSLRDANREVYNYFKKPFLIYKKSDLKINHSDLSAEEHEKIRSEIQIQSKKRSRIAWIVTSISVIALFIAILYLIDLMKDIDFRFPSR